VFTWKKQKTKGQPADRVHLEETEDQGTAG